MCACRKVSLRKARRTNHRQIVEQSEMRTLWEHVADILRILALLINFSLVGCGTPEKDTAPANKTEVPAGQTQSEHHRAACLPQEGGGIICQ